MPGLKVPLEAVNVAVFAPEQARLRDATPPPRAISAAWERWQRVICSPVPEALS